MIHPAPATLYLYTDAAFRVPVPEDVRAVIQLLNLTADQVARLVGLKDGRAVRRWLAPQDSKTHARIDYATWRLLLLEAGLVRLKKRRRQKRNPLSGTKAAMSTRLGEDTVADNREGVSLAVPRQHR